MGVTGHEQIILTRLMDEPLYASLFDEAFPGEANAVTFLNIADALAHFTRSIISVNSPFDQYAYGGDDTALTPAQLRGLDLFMSERLECHHCHGGFNFSDSSSHALQTAGEQPFHQTGLKPGADQGVYGLSLDDADRGRFRAPSLRNVGITAPYMHDGRFTTLREVIDFYDSGGINLANKSILVRPLGLKEEEKLDLMAFLETLTDPSVLVNEAYSDPWKATVQH